MSLADKQAFKELLEEITWDMFHLFHIIDIFMLISNDSWCADLSTSSHVTSDNIKRWQRL